MVFLLRAWRIIHRFGAPFAVGGALVQGSTTEGKIMTGKHAADLPVHVRRCQDNVPYMWYFDKATEIGFEWTGNPEDPIEVSQGGFGEPITNIITESTGGWSLAKCVEFNETRLNQPGLLYTFFWVSHSWLEHITADIRGREPQMVVGRG